jgi:hypothetical protein
VKHKIVYNSDFGGFALSDKAINWLSEHGSDKTKKFIAQKRLEANGKTINDSTKIFYVMDAIRNFLDRHDPDLVAVVETLGKEVNDTFSSLAIEEIDGDMYNIEEYDGKETVVTPDDTCWTVIK